MQTDKNGQRILLSVARPLGVTVAVTWLISLSSKKWSLTYFGGLCVAIATVKVKLIPDFYTLTSFCSN